MGNVEKATQLLGRLSEDKLKIALFMLELLALKEEVDATEEILADENLMAAIQASREAKSQGRDEFVSWDEFRNV